MAVDPGDGRFLWSVRWPSHRCTNEKCEEPTRGQRFRYGKADTETAAMKAMETALADGRPE